MQREKFGKLSKASGVKGPTGRLLLAVSLVMIVLLSACADGSSIASTPTVTTEIIERVEPTATVTTAPTNTPLPTLLPVTPSPTQLPATPTPTLSPATPTPAPSSAATGERLDLFVEQLKEILAGEDWEAIEGISAETVYYGIHPLGISEWDRLARPGEVQFSYIIAGSQPNFNSEIPPNIEPADYYPGAPPIARVLHGNGFGPDQLGDSLIYIVETGQTDQPYALGGIVLSYEQFAPQPDYPTVAQPAGTYFSRDQALWRVEQDGSGRLVFKCPYNTSCALNPQETRAVVHDKTNAPDVLTLHNLTDDSEQIVPIDDRFLAGSLLFFDDWLDERTAILGLMLAQEEYGPSMGHLVLLDADSGAMNLIDEIGRLTSPPAVANGTIIWSTFERPAPNLFRLDGGVRQPLDASPLLSLGVAPNDSSAFSPSLDPSGSGRVAWWTKGIDEGITLVVVDGDTAQALRSVDLSGMGSFTPPAMWSPDGNWLASGVYSRLPSQQGIHLHNLATDDVVRFGIGAHSPQWLDDTRLIYWQQLSSGSEVRLYDTATGETVVIDEPEGGRYARVRR